MTLIIRNKKGRKVVHRITIIAGSEIWFGNGWVEVKHPQRGVKAIAYDFRIQQLIVE